MTMIEEIRDENLKYLITKHILSALPEWFADPRAVERYAEESKHQAFFAFSKNAEVIGFISFEIHHLHTGEIIVMGVKPTHRRKGIGKLLFQEAETYLKNHGCDYVKVKTLAEEANYEPYEQTRKFYVAMGFEPVKTTTEVWGGDNPCLIMENRI